MRPPSQSTPQPRCASPSSQPLDRATALFRGHERSGRDCLAVPSGLGLLGERLCGPFAAGRRLCSTYVAGRRLCSTDVTGGRLCRSHLVRNRVRGAPGGDQGRPGGDGGDQTGDGQPTGGGGGGGGGGKGESARPH